MYLKIFVDALFLKTIQTMKKRMLLFIYFLCF